MFKRRRSKTQSPHSVGSGGSSAAKQQEGTTAAAGGGGSGAGGSSAASASGGGGGSDGSSSQTSSPPVPRSCIRVPSSHSSDDGGGCTGGGDGDGPPSLFPIIDAGRSTGNGSNGTLTAAASLEGSNEVISHLTTSTTRTPHSSNGDRPPPTARSSRRRRHGVRFRHVVVREFERVIGDNPSCSGGAPISIGWAFGRDRVMNVEEYEAARPVRRTQHELVLTRQDREEILVEWGATFNEIIDSIRANVKAKNQRRRTVNAIGTYDRWEEAMESAGRKLKQTLLLQKTTKRQVQDLTRRSEMYAAKAHPAPPSHHPNEITAPSSTDHDDDVEALSLPEYYEEVDCDRSSSISNNKLDRSDLGRSTGSRSAGGVSQLTNSSPEAVEPDDEAGNELALLGVDEIPVPRHHPMAEQQQGGRHPHPPHSDRWRAPDQHQRANNQANFSQPQPQQQEYDPAMFLPCEGPVLEVGFSREQAMADPDDDLSTWCVTVDEYQHEYAYGGPWDMTNATTEEDSMMGGPAILQTNMVPVVISEDGQYDLFEYNGFTMQPPPYSNQIISKWE